MTGPLTPLGRLAAGLAIALTVVAAPTHAQETKFHGFTDVTYRNGRRLSDTSAFALGQFDLYVTSRLAEKVSFLSETVFEFEPDAGEFVVDVERVIVTFAPTAHLRFAAGKHHTPIGFWNNAYHHGAAMQPTIERPGLFDFEDEGGILPIHTVGILAAGRDLTRAHLGYDVLVGNNIGGTAESDTRAAKSVTLAVHSQVTSMLRVGASLYSDRLAAGTATLRGDSLAFETTQRIFGGFVAYQGRAIEVIGEYQGMRNTPDAPSTSAVGPVTTATGIVGYAGYRVGAVVPYLVYDETRGPNNDVYLPAGTNREGTFGLRYEYAATTVFKLELSRQAKSGTPTASVLTLQVAVGF